MRSRVQRDPLRGRPRRSWVLDATVSLCVLLIGSALVTGAGTEAVPSVIAWLTVVAMGLPLLVRRVWPLPVFVWSCVLAAVSGWWGAEPAWSAALTIALYTVASRCSRRTSIVSAAALAAGVVAWSVREYDGDERWQMVTLVVVVAAVTILGLYVGTRRTLLLELRDRALRLERERDQQAELSAAAERARIAREMHDIVAHHLTVMVALADGAAAQSARSPRDAGDAMRAVSATGRQALTDTRRLLGVLREQTDLDYSTDGPAPMHAPMPGLGDLDELIDGVRAAGLPVDFRVTGTLPELDPGIQLALYRVVQEALTNTMKHAGPAVAACVRIRRDPAVLVLDVEDDGAGVAGARGSGRGLLGMRERIAAVGGEVTAGPVAGRGWAVRVSLPLPSSVVREES